MKLWRTRRATRCARWRSASAWCWTACARTISATRRRTSSTSSITLSRRSGWASAKLSSSSTTWCAWWRRSIRSDGPKKKALLSITKHVPTAFSLVAKMLPCLYIQCRNCFYFDYSFPPLMCHSSKQTVLMTMIHPAQCNLTFLHLFSLLSTEKHCAQRPQARKHGAKQTVSWNSTMPRVQSIYPARNLAR